MIKPKILILLLLISTISIAQNEKDIIPFNKLLDQFISVRDFCLSKNGKEAFFTIQSPNQEISQLAYIKKKENQWEQPELLAFGDSFMYLEPFLSDDGNRLFFVSDRPMNDSITIKKDFDIWYIDRDSENEKWSKPKNLGKQVNSELDEFYPSVSKNNNLYFTMVSPDGIGKDDIYFCEWKGDAYAKPELLHKNINTPGYEFNAFISKKEDFLIFSRYNENDGQGSGDLYISKKDKNGVWKKATNLGTPINTKYMEYCPFYDEKNQTLYFTSKRNTIQPIKLNTVSEYQNYIQHSKNGLSKIYKTSLIIN